MPANALLRIRSDDCSRGSGRPRESCVFRIAARYDLIDWGARPESAKKAANEHRRGSVTGKGSAILKRSQKQLNRLMAET